jgi:methylenetetrahydrofolate dehydrogenase (NADP+)/methenyltetrahydrofolate cyclohydrolase
MTAQIIDGKQIAANIRAKVADDVKAMKAETGYTPGLATVLVGDDPASATYVRMKQRACAEADIRSIGKLLPTDTSQDELVELVSQLNMDPGVNGILVQLPLPDHIDEETVLNSIDLKKDVERTWRNIPGERISSWRQSAEPR